MPRFVAAQRFCSRTLLSQSVPNVPKHSLARPWHAPTGAINAVTDRAGVTWGQLNSKMGRVPKPIGRVPRASAELTPSARARVRSVARRQPLHGLTFADDLPAVRRLGHHAQQPGAHLSSRGAPGRQAPRTDLGLRDRAAAVLLAPLAALVYQPFNRTTGACAHRTPSTAAEWVEAALAELRLAPDTNHLLKVVTWVKAHPASPGIAKGQLAGALERLQREDREAEQQGFDLVEVAA